MCLHGCQCCTTVQLLYCSCTAGAQFEVLETRGQPHLKPRWTNNGTKQPLVMQIQCVNIDCLKERKKLEVLTRIQLSLRPFFATLFISVHPSLSPCTAHLLHSLCMFALTVARFNQRHCPGSLSNFSSCHRRTMLTYQQLCYGSSTVPALLCQRRLRPCYMN